MFKHGADATRIYEGTETRADGILFSAALAILVTKDKGYRLTPRVFSSLVGFVGLDGVGLLFWWLQDYSPHIYRWGLLALSVATVAIITAAIDGPSLSPLRWIGERSYGIYLWHMPTILPLAVEGPPAVARLRGYGHSCGLGSHLVDVGRRSYPTPRSIAPVKNWMAQRNSLPRMAWAIPATVLVAVPAMGVPAAFNDLPG